MLQGTTTFVSLSPEALSELVKTAVADALNAKASPPAEADAILNREQMAAVLDVSPVTLWNMYRSGQIPHFKARGRVLFRKAEVLAALQNAMPKQGKGKKGGNRA